MTVGCTRGLDLRFAVGCFRRVGSGKLGGQQRTEPYNAASEVSCWNSPRRRPGPQTLPPGGPQIADSIEVKFGDIAVQKEMFWGDLAEALRSFWALEVEL